MIGDLFGARRPTERMEPYFLDHALVAVLALVLPVWGRLDFQRLERDLRGGNERARLRGYRRIMAVEWGLAAVALLGWLGYGRSWSGLGLVLARSGGFWIAVVLTLAACALLVLQWRSIVGSAEKLTHLREKIGNLEPMLPVSERDARWFGALSITAGICEEILYRGFLIAYLEVSTGTVPAVVVSCLVFGFGHAYQGLAGVAKTAVIGGVMAGLYLLSGSLYLPILLHATLDITNGLMVRQALIAGSGPDSSMPDSGEK